jgi:hypothetical protein
VVQQSVSVAVQPLLHLHHQSVVVSVRQVSVVDATVVVQDQDQPSVVQRDQSVVVRAQHYLVHSVDYASLHIHHHQAMHHHQAQQAPSAGWVLACSDHV